MEAEVREILTRASVQPHIGLSLLNAARTVGDSADELLVPERRDEARVVDFE